MSMPHIVKLTATVFLSGDLRNSTCGTMTTAMLTPTLVIYERRPRWVPELQRQFLGQDIRVRAASTLRDWEQLLLQSPQAVGLIELDAAPSQCLECLSRLMTRHPGPTVIVITSAELRELEWPIRELGATLFLEEPLSGEEMAHHCRRALLLE